jgi:hypothetical protein
MLLKRCLKNKIGFAVRMEVASPPVFRASFFCIGFCGLDKKDTANSLLNRPYIVRFYGLQPFSNY